MSRRSPKSTSTDALVHETTRGRYCRCGLENASSIFEWNEVLQLYLPIAEMSVNLFFLVGIGGAVGFLSGLFGVGGGLLLTPVLIFCGRSEEHTSDLQSLLRISYSVFLLTRQQYSYTNTHEVT